MAQASEDAARLSGLSQLTAHYGELMKATKSVAYDEVRDSAALGGIHIDIKDPEAFERLKEVTAYYKRFTDDLEEIYARLFGRPTLGARRWNPSEPDEESDGQSTPTG